MSGYGPLSGGSIFNLGGYMEASTVYSDKPFSSEQFFWGEVSSLAAWLHLPADVSGRTLQKCFGR